MAKDPAWLFYPADASDDTQFLNRLERGCYFDLLKAQKKFARFTIDIIKKVLGKDFDTCWASIESILKKDDAGYFIEWVDNSIERRKEFSKIQSKRISDYHDKKKKEVDNVTVEEPAYNRGSTDELPLVNENAIENEIINEKGNETANAKKESQGKIFDSIVIDWNTYAEKNNKSKLKKLSDERKRKLVTRMREKEFDFREILRIADGSKFIRDGTWFSFDWVVESEKNYLKVLEGNYNQNGSGTTAKPATGANVDLSDALAKIDKHFG